MLYSKYAWGVIVMSNRLSDSANTLHTDQSPILAIEKRPDALNMRPLLPGSFVKPWCQLRISDGLDLTPNHGLEPIMEFRHNAFYDW